MEKSWFDGLLRKKGQGRKQILSASNIIQVKQLDKAVEKHCQNVKVIQVGLIKELSVSMRSDTVKRFFKRVLTY